MNKRRDHEEKLRSEQGAEIVNLPCLYCGEPHPFRMDSNEANGVFNVYCPDKDCEDTHAASF